MSRHRIPGIDPKLEITVGWDPPLRTYFGIAVDDSADDDTRIHFWIGTDFDEIPSVTVLIERMKPVAVVSPEVELILLEDRRLRR